MPGPTPGNFDESRASLVYDWLTSSNSGIDQFPEFQLDKRKGKLNRIRLKNASEPPASFRHHAELDGTIFSICRSCHAIVATSQNKNVIRFLEGKHECGRS